MILHAFWQPLSGVMSFWGEQEESALHGSLPQPPRHPADLSFKQLVGLLPDELDMYEEQRRVLLPSRDNTPVSSVAEIPPDATLKYWNISVGEAISDSALDGLTRLGEGNRDLQLGDSVYYWQRLFSFALWLFDLRLYLPGAVRLEGRYYPAWQSMFSEDAESAWQQLIERMPPICRALDGVTSCSPDEIAVSFVDAALDAFVRQRLLRQNPKFRAQAKSLPPLHRQWVSSLKGGHLGFFRGAENRIHAFVSSLVCWCRPLRPIRQNLGFRLGFNLLAPPNEQEPWDVCFFVQSLRHPSICFDARQIWRGSADVARFSPALQETLLRDLGSLLDVWPGLIASLQQPQPFGFKLQREEARYFLIAIAPELRRRGFPLKLPGCLQDHDSGIGLRLRLSPTAGKRAGQTTLGLAELVHFQWEAAVGKCTLTLDELRGLADEQSSLIFHDGRWFRIDPERIRQTFHLLDQQAAAGETSVWEALQTGRRFLGKETLPLVDLRVDEGAANLFFLSGDDSFTPLPTPDGFVGTLRPYQITGFSWLVYTCQMGIGVCLADDMGLGKTIQMIAALLHWKRERRTISSLIVCPLSVVGNWKREIQRFAPSLKVMVHHGAGRLNKKNFSEAVKKYDVLITTYLLAVRDHAVLAREKWDALILDEAQNIKNPRTKQAVAIRSIQANDRICLTGTPVENHLGELWSIMEFLNPGYLGRETEFRRQFSLPIEREKDSDRAQFLSEMIRPFVLRRLKSDRNVIRDLPEKQEMKVFCNLTREQAAIYQRVVDEMLVHVDTRPENARRGIVLATLVKLKQITNHPYHFYPDHRGFLTERSGKLQRLEAMLEVILDEGHNALIFTQFAELGRLLQEKLMVRFGIDVLFMQGATSQAQRDQMVQRFQRASGPPIFILTLKTGGSGLNLTAANHVFHIDRWWNPAVEDQATDRAYRIGQTRNVQVHKFICAGTVEEHIDRMIEEKKQLFASVIGSGENWLAELSTEKLRNIFTLSREAIIE